MLPLLAARLGVESGASAAHVAQSVAVRTGRAAAGQPFLRDDARRSMRGGRLVVWAPRVEACVAMPGDAIGQIFWRKADLRYAVAPRRAAQGTTVQASVTCQTELPTCKMPRARPCQHRPGCFNDMRVSNPSHRPNVAETRGAHQLYAIATDETPIATINGGVHGGLIAALAESRHGQWCPATRRRAGRLRTSQIGCAIFFAAGGLGDFLIARSHVVRLTRSIVFMRCEVFRAGRPRVAHR